MKIAVGSDHRGFELKEEIREYLSSSGHEVKDFGCFSKDSCDYPEFAMKAAEAVAGGAFEKGVLFCGTGIGMCLAANKVPKIRAAVIHDEKDARRASSHNNANVVCIGSESAGKNEAKKMIGTWLKTPFEGGRHAMRLEMVRKIEDKYAGKRGND